MRILISTGIFPNRQDENRGIYILKQAVALSRIADVRVIAPVPYVPRFVRSGKYASFTNIPKRDTVEDLDVLYPRYVVIPGVFRFLHGFFIFASVLAVHRRVIRSFKPDLVLSYFAYPFGTAVVLIAKLFRLPVFVGCLGSDINVLAMGGIQRRIIAWTLRSSDRVLSVSSALRKATLELGVDGTRSVVIPNGTDRDRFRRISQYEARRKLDVVTSKQVVVAVNRLSHEKGVDVLIRAFAEISDPGVELWIIGDGVQRPELERQVRSYGLEASVRFLGAKPHSEVPMWMSAGDLLALPSRAEGHPNAVVEALACGRPVVATKVGGVPETVYSAEMGLLVEPDDVSGLAAGIKEALRTKWEPARIAELGGTRTWDDVAREIVREMESLDHVHSSVEAKVG